MIGDIVSELLGVALAPSGKFGESLAALLCMVSALFSLAFGIWLAFVGVEDAPFVFRVGIVAFFALITIICLYLLRRFIRKNAKKPSK